MPLVTLLSARRVATLYYDDLANVDRRSGYVEVKRTIRVHPGSLKVATIDDDTAARLEDYLNALPMPSAVPFQDYRPDIGSPYLFPSPRSLGSLSQWAISRIVRRQRRLTGLPPPLPKHVARRSAPRRRRGPGTATHSLPAGPPDGGGG